MKEFFDWFEASIEAHPEGWMLGLGFVLAVCFGAWLHKKLTHKEKKA